MKSKIFCLKIIVVFLLVLVKTNIVYAQNLQDGYQALMEKEYETAYEVFNSLAKDNNKDAEYYLGYIYEKGLGIAQDNTKALEFFEKSAAQNHLEAQLKTVWFYEKGLGTEVNDDKALYWLQKAADNGHQGAKNRILLYQNKTKLNAQEETSESAVNEKLDIEAFILNQITEILSQGVKEGTLKIENDNMQITKNANQYQVTIPNLWFKAKEKDNTFIDSLVVDVDEVKEPINPNEKFDLKTAFPKLIKVFDNENNLVSNLTMANNSLFLSWLPELKRVMTVDFKADNLSLEHLKENKQITVARTNTNLEHLKKEQNLFDINLLSEVENIAFLLKQEKQGEIAKITTRFNSIDVDILGIQEAMKQAEQNQSKIRYLDFVKSSDFAINIAGMKVFKEKEAPIEFTDFKIAAQTSRIKDDLDKTGVNIKIKDLKLYADLFGLALDADVDFFDKDSSSTKGEVILSLYGLDNLIETSKKAFQETMGNMMNYAASSSSSEEEPKPEEKTAVISKFNPSSLLMPALMMVEPYRKMAKHQTDEQGRELETYHIVIPSGDNKITINGEVMFPEKEAN